MNIQHFDNINLLTIPGFILITDNLRSTNGLSRAGLLVKNSLKFNTKQDLTNPNDAHIAITIHLTNTKKLNIHSFYCQWQELTPTGRVPNTRNIKAQKNRLTETAAFFQKSIQEQETIILADSNINTQYINTPDNSKSPQEKQISKVTDVFKSQLLDKGLTILNIANNKPNNNNETITIDHILTTHPQLTTNTTTLNVQYSDHYPDMTTRVTKAPHQAPRFNISRQYKNIYFIEMTQAINNDPRLYSAMNNIDSDFIANSIIETITEHLDQRAPIRKIQTKGGYTEFISDTTKELTEARNKAWQELQTDNSPDNR